MIEMTSHRDENDFGLEQTPGQDAADLAALHDQLLSQDWKLVRELDVNPSDIAVIDYKHRVLYASAARPDDWNKELDLATLPELGNAVQHSASLLWTVRYDQPAFLRARLFSARTPHGVAVLFVRALEHAGQPGGAFLQFIDGQDVLNDIQLDAETRLELVAADGAVGDVPDGLVRAAPPEGDIEQISDGGKSYLVQARPLTDQRGQKFATVVMARSIDSVLSLFPHARAVFALAMLAALGLSFATTLRARQITGARI
jgi:hypothetical protein